MATRRIFMAPGIKDARPGSDQKLIRVANGNSRGAAEAGRVAILDEHGREIAAVVVYPRKRTIAGHAVKACVEVFDETKLRIE